MRTWQLDAMFAGVEGAGAEDAWWETAFHLEHHKLHGVPSLGATCDIYKCFDQIFRPLLVHIARIAGFPTHILEAYARYQNDLIVHNGMAMGLGEGHKRQCGIPQGCPF